MAYCGCCYLSVSTQCVHVCVISLVHTKDLEPNQVWIKALNKYLLNEWMSFLWLKYFIFYYIVIKSIGEGYASFLSVVSFFVLPTSLQTCGLLLHDAYATCFPISGPSHVLFPLPGMLSSLPPSTSPLFPSFAKFLMMNYLSRGSSFIILSKHLPA